MYFRIMKSFAKDLKNINDKKLLEKIRLKTEEIKKIIATIENVDEIPYKIKDTNKITGTNNAYRIKIDDSYRIGVEIDTEFDTENNKEILFFSLKRFLHRKDIYNKFPN